MVATAPGAPRATRPASSARPPARSRAHPARIDIEKHEVVGRFMDCSARATRSIEATSAAVQVALMFLSPGPERDAIQSALHDVYGELKELVKSARMSSNRYESERPSR